MKSDAIRPLSVSAESTVWRRKKRGKNQLEKEGEKRLTRGESYTQGYTCNLTFVVAALHSIEVSSATADYRATHLFIESSDRDGRTKPSGPDRCVRVIASRCVSSVPMLDSRRAGIGLHEAGSGR